MKDENCRGISTVGHEASVAVEICRTGLQNARFWDGDVYYWGETIVG
jgi:hypothetical protein